MNIINFGNANVKVFLTEVEKKTKGEDLGGRWVGKDPLPNVGSKEILSQVGGKRTILYY